MHENVGKVVGSNGRGTGGNNGTWVRKNGKWVQEETTIDESPVQNVLRITNFENTKN